MRTNKKKKMTKSESLEMTKTLVLNFNELERVANYEKKTSKKPAIVVALIGLFAIMSGLFYPTVDNMLNKKDESHQFRVSKEKKYKKVVCTKTLVPKENKSTAKNTLIFKFEKDSLISYENSYVETPNSMNMTETPRNIITIYDYMKPLTALTIPGYELKQDYTVSDTNSKLVTKLDLNLNVDLEQFDSTKLTDKHKSNAYLNVTYTYGDNSINIKQKLMSAGYTCD
ncbi:MAG: hypothetical protein E7160_01550 [Firmicutes bacterium]|nr:hypothetical protein [Bacillota bacterium]